MKLKYTLATTMFFMSGSFAFADENWVVVSTTNESVYSIKKDSLEFSETKGGVAIAVVIGRDSNKKTSNIIVEKWYVSANDCKNNMGKLVTLNISGEYKYENEFVFSSGNSAGQIAETICAVADYIIKKSAEEKSL